VLENRTYYTAVGLFGNIGDGSISAVWAYRNDSNSVFVVRFVCRLRLT
jgi:hypothetical protein